jgi:proteic killer suppression protein
MVIKSFRGSDNERVFDDLPSKTFQSVHSVARRKLLSLNAATSLNDLRAVPGNRFEALKQDRAGQHAIRINDQYRICFVWREGDAYEVEITKHYS